VIDQKKRGEHALRLTSFVFDCSGYGLAVSTATLAASALATAALIALSSAGLFAALSIARLLAALLAAAAIAGVFHSVLWHGYPPCSK
jgi:hypothetical protein